MHKKLLSLLIMLGAGYSLNASTVTFSTTQPTVGTYDIAQLVGAESDNDNAGTPAGAADGAGNDGTTYVAMDRAAQGQTFKTINGVLGYDYVITAVSIQHPGYTANTNSTWYNLLVNGTITLRIVDPLYKNSSKFVLAEEVYTIAGDEENIIGTPGTVLNSTNGTDTWVTITLDEPVHIAAGSTYGYDIAGGANLFFETNGNVQDIYTSGTAYTSGSSGAGGTNFTAITGDRVFIIHVTPVYTPWSPTPTHNQMAVPADSDLEISWHTAKDPSNTANANPNVAKHYLFGNFEYGDPNMAMIAEIDAGTPVQDLATYTLTGSLTPERDKSYSWYVVEGIKYPNGTITGPEDPNSIKSLTWSFMTELSTPELNENYPSTAIVHPNSEAALTVDAVNPFTGDATGLSYQWYKDDVIMTGETSSSYVVPNAALANEGTYYCIVTLDSNGKTSTSNSAKIIIKKEVAHWTFDGSLEDSANGYDGTATGTFTYGTGVTEETGDQSLVFDGSENYVTLPEGFADFTSGMTISLWTKPTAATSYARFIDFGNGAPDDNIYFFRSGTDATLAFSVADGTSTGTAVAWGNTLVLNEWQFIAVTMDQNGLVMLYKDGIPLFQSSVTVPNVVTRTLNYIGDSNWEADALYQGEMDDMIIYNYALSEDEIATDFAAVNGNFCRTQPEYDLTNDCKVNILDFAIIAADWMKCGIYPASSCN